MQFQSSQLPAPDSWSGKPLAVLFSGGVDSAVLLEYALQRCPQVTPVYVRCGLAWETAEEAALRRFLAAVKERERFGSLRPLVVCHFSARECYGPHWSITGENVPNAHTPDEAVFLPGRNMMLLLPASLWCYRHHVPAIAMGTLKANPFPDAEDSFFRKWTELFDQSVGARIRIVQPLHTLTKSEVIRLGGNLPLELTFSCIAPVNGMACRECNKCAEREIAFSTVSSVDVAPHTLR